MSDHHFTTFALLHHLGHNPTMRKNFPCTYTGQTHQCKEWLSLKKGRGSLKIFLAHLTPLSFSHTIPFLPHLTVIPFYFGQIFYHPLTHMTARKSISVTPTDSEALKAPRTAQLHLPKGPTEPWCWLSPGLCPTPGSEAVFAAAFQQQHRDSSEQSSDRSWGHLAQSCA